MGASIDGHNKKNGNPTDSWLPGFSTFYPHLRFALHSSSHAYPHTWHGTYNLAYPQLFSLPHKHDAWIVSQAYVTDTFSTCIYDVLRACAPGACIEYVILISRVILDRYPCLLLAAADEKWPDLTPSRESFRRESGVRGSTFNLFEIDRSTDLGTWLGDLVTTSQTFLRIQPCSSIATSHYHCQTTVYLGGCDPPEGPS